MSPSLDWERANERDALRREVDRRDQRRREFLEEQASAILRDAGFDPETG